jgi:hypothetical protein
MGVDAKRIKDKWDRKGKKADRMELQDGDNYIRLLPPSLEYLKDTVDYIHFEYPMHYKLGIEGNTTSEPCPKVHGKMSRCPVCETVFKLYSTKDADDKALAGKIRAKTRYIFNAIDLNNLDKGVQILETGSKIYDAILKFITNPKYSDILDLDKGRNLTITKTPEKESSSGFVDYDVIPDPDITSIKEQLPANWKEQIVKLKIAPPPTKSYDELKKILEGEDPGVAAEASETVETVDEPVEEAAPAPAAVKKPAPKPAPAAEKPECFGKDYGPKKEECVACDFKAPCREDYLKID